MRWWRRRSRPGAAERLEVAAAELRAEHEAAVARMLEARRGWNAPTAQFRPLLTPGQEYRGQGGRRS